MKGTKGITFLSRSCCVAGLLLGAPLMAAQPAPEAWPPFAEVYGLIQSNLTSVSAEELDAAAVRGLLDRLAPRAALLPATPPPVAATNLIAAAELHDGHVAYLRVGQFAPGLAEEFARQLTDLTKGMEREGLVLDLRFTGGWAYGEVAPLADFFINRRVALLDWGAGMRESKAGGREFSAPVTLLVNARTTGAACVFAGALRQTQAALLIGETTAGEAFAFREFPLSNGSRLRLAKGRVRLGDGSEFPETGIEPDIPVSVPLKEQEAYVKNPRVVLADATNPATRAPDGTGPRRLTEAALVRLHSRGLTNVTGDIVPEDLSNPPTDEPAEAAKGGDKPVAAPITDPMLARALDLLKGLAIVRAATRK